MQEDDELIAEEMCDVNQMEGEEIEEAVHIPADTSKTNAKNSNIMMYKDMKEADKQNILHNQDREIRYVDRIVYA